MGNVKSSGKAYRYLLVGGTRAEKLALLKQIVDEFSLLAPWRNNRKKARSEAFKLLTYLMNTCKVLISLYNDSDIGKLQRQDGDSKERTSEFELACKYFQDLDLSLIDFDNYRSSDTKRAEQIISEAKFARLLKAVWTHETIQQEILPAAIENEYVSDFVVDLFARLEEISTPGWQPTRFDVLCTMQKKKRTFEAEVHHKGLHVLLVANMTDVVNPADKIREDLFDFDDEDEAGEYYGVVFLTRLDQFDEETSTTYHNAMLDSIEQFREMTSKLLADHRIVLCMTHKQEFVDKLRSGKLVSSTFAHYDGANEYDPVFEFLCRQFEEVRDPGINATTIYFAELESNRNIRGNLKFAFRSVRQSIIENRMAITGIGGNPENPDAVHENVDII